MKFGEKRLFTNFYCILVGPAGIAHKTEAINDAVGVLEGFVPFITDDEFKGENDVIRFMKCLNIISDKASPEALLEALDPRNKEPKGQNYVGFRNADGTPKLNPGTGRQMWYTKTAEAIIVAHEFSTFAGQQKYNTGLTDNLLALYECDRSFSWRTVKRKRITLKNLHTTLIAGTTLTAFRSSLSDNVRTDGFLSRTMMVYCPKTIGRRFSRPQIVPGAPNEKELQRRLAWIAKHGVGEFDLTPEADAYYDKWYLKWREELENDSLYQGLKSRLHIMVLKIALLLRLQRYDDGPRVIDVEDIKEAIMIIKRTWYEALPVMKGFEDGKRAPFLGRIEEYIRDRKEVTRAYLMQRGHFSATEVHEGIQMLADEGKVEIDKEGAIMEYPGSNSKEVYRWIGERWLGSKALEE